MAQTQQQSTAKQQQHGLYVISILQPAEFPAFSTLLVQYINMQTVVQACIATAEQRTYAQHCSVACSSTCQRMPPQSSMLPAGRQPAGRYRAFKMYLKLCKAFLWGLQAEATFDNI
jgi:hypothetical protein